MEKFPYGKVSINYADKISSTFLYISLCKLGKVPLDDATLLNIKALGVVVLDKKGLFYVFPFIYFHFPLIKKDNQW